MNEIYEILERIEKLLMSNKVAFDVNAFSIYSGLSKSAIHKLTQRRRLKYSRPNGKLIWFHKDDIDKFLLSNPVLPDADVEKMAIDYTINNPKRKWDSA